MRFFITGGAGFLGLHLATYLHKQGADVVLYDIAAFDKKEYADDVMCIQGDVRDRVAVDKAMKGCDVVIHAAAALPLCSAEEILDTNIRGTHIVLDAALRNKIKRFVYVSSTAVYGVPIKHPIEETDPMVGVGPYGHSKIESEHLCQEYREKGLVVSVVRPKTFVGTHRLGVFEILFNWIKDGKKIPVIGSGDNHYQLLDVEDLVEAIYLLSIHKNKDAINDNFNIAAEKFLTVKEDLQELFDHVGSKSTVLSTPALPIKIALRILEMLHLSPLYQWVYDTADKDSYASINKIKKTLEWAPKYSNAQALIRSYNWYKDHYQEIKKGGSGTTHTVGWNQGALGFFKRFL